MAVSAAARDSSFSTAPQGSTFWIARGYTSGYFNGKISDVKVYSRALSSAEVLSQYNAGRCAPSQSTTNTTITFTMDQHATAIAEYAVSLEGEGEGMAAVPRRLVRLAR